MNYLIWLWHNSRGIRWNSALRILMGLSRVTLGLLMVWLCKLFIDQTIRTGSNSEILIMILLLVVTMLGRIGFNQAFSFMTVSANIVQKNRMRLRLFNNLFNRLLFTEQQLHSADVSSRLAKDIEVVSEATTSILPDIIVTGCQLMGAFLLMRSMDARLAWAILLLTPFAIAFGKFISHRLRTMTLTIREGESRIQTQIQEGVEQNAVLRALGSEEWMTEQLDLRQQQLKGDVMRRARFTVVMRLLFGAAFGLGYLMAFIWGGLQLRNGAITFGVMTSFLQLVGQIQQPILSLLNSVTQFIHATASIDRLKEMESSPDPQTSPEYSSSCDFSLHESLGISVTDISFRYASGDRMVFDHYSRQFQPGSKVAIMGATGIGKTTLFRLLLALIEPANGSICLFRKDGTEQPVSESTRQYFVFVPQGNTLISGTIRYNLQLAMPNATDEELSEVLHTAVADFVYDLPEGIDTELGEHGSGLSEGQAQRIAIARGLLRPGTILLLDEISASLDEQTEQELYTRLFKKYPEKTMLFITHRPSVSKLCDEIVNFE